MLSDTNSAVSIKTKKQKPFGFQLFSFVRNFFTIFGPAELLSEMEVDILFGHWPAVSAFDLFSYITV